MEISITPNEGGYLVHAKLVLEDKVAGGDAVLEARYRLPHGEVLETLTDPTKTRAIASLLVGRMTTNWKLDLITGVGEAVVEALRGAVAGSLAATAPED